MRADSCGWSPTPSPLPWKIDSMKLTIRQAGEAVLRRKARILSKDEILGSYIQELIESMRDTMRETPGVGLAAPQIGAPLQLAVIADRPAYIDKLTKKERAERGRKPVPYHVVINPKLILEPDESAEFFEGCLS